MSTVFGASVRNGIVKSFEEKYGQSRTMTLGVTLDGNVCNDWRVKKYETRRLGYFSAPRMGVKGASFQHCDKTQDFTNQPLRSQKQGAFVGV
ncbi:MAG: hypothetical protein R3D66_03245 [Alphaproteobacteria bacterium]